MSATAPTSPAEHAAAVLKQAETAHMPIALVEVEHLRALLTDLDTFHRAMDALVTHVHNTHGLDEKCNEIVRGLAAKGLWA